MLRFALGIALSVFLVACSDKDQPPARTAAAAKAPAGDIAAGKAFADRECKGCHGLDGKGAAPAIPNLAGQRENYLLLALREYRDGKRTHAALRAVAGQMNDPDARNLAAYFASLPPVAASAATAAQLVSPYEQGKALTQACVKCHTEDGNSKIPGIPTLAGQQPRYFVVAVQEYLNGERKTSPMHAMLRGLSRPEMENIALYFASQTPAERAAPPSGDPGAGEPLSAVCGGCHGAHGVSTDTVTPSLAGQDPGYLTQAIKAYRTTRKRENMRLYVTGLSDKDIANIAAFYTVQKSRPAEKGEKIIQELTGKCERCHGAAADNPAMVVPKIRGQDRDYLIMALRAYRDDKRESSMMHKMSLPYGDTVIESIASYYASQPAK